MAILAAIDENERSKKVVELAYDLATAYDDTLIALHVIPEEEYEKHRETMQEIAEFADFNLEQEQESAERFAEKFVRETIDDIDRNQLEARGRVGDVGEAILAEAEQVDPRYLVISGRRRSPTGKAIFGNTAQKILLNAECPVVSKLSDD